MGVDKANSEAVQRRAAGRQVAGGEEDRSSGSPGGGGDGDTRAPTPGGAAMDRDGSADQGDA